MAPARRLALALVVCLLLGLGWATAIQPLCHDPSHLRALRQDTSGDDISAEQKGVLHRLLHAYFPARYQHGVYPSDDEALDAVRADDAGLATAIARIAKRQNDNTTSASQQPPPTDGTTTVTTATTVTAGPPPPGTTSTTTSDNKPPPTTTTTTTSTDNNNPPPAETSTTKPPAGTTTPGNPTAKQSNPTTTLATTPSSAATLSPSPTTFTSTDPNGNLVIVTSTSFVHVNPTGTKAGSTTSSTPGLQNAAMPLRTNSLLSDPFGAFIAGLMMLLAF